MVIVTISIHLEKILNQKYFGVDLASLLDTQVMKKLK